METDNGEADSEEEGVRQSPNVEDLSGFGVDLVGMVETPSSTDAHIFLRPYTPNDDLMARFGLYEGPQVLCKSIYMGMTCIVGMLIPTGEGWHVGHKCHCCKHYFHGPCVGERPSLMLEVLVFFSVF